ncbi:hypothetical protein L3Q82_012768, partial [Scortum barcoo]
MSLAGLGTPRVPPEELEEVSGVNWDVAGGDKYITHVVMQKQKQGGTDRLNYIHESGVVFVNSAPEGRAASWLHAAGPVPGLCYRYRKKKDKYFSL